MLTIDGGSDIITSGERRNYHVTWKNVSNQPLTKVVLRVLLPQAMTLETTNKGSFSSADNTLTLNINTLNPNEGGELFLVANANGTFKEGELAVVVANLVYTDQSSTQGDALAYATHTAHNAQSSLGAFAFGAGTFLPVNLFGWLLLIILVLILVLLGKYLYGEFSRPKPA